MYQTAARLMLRPCYDGWLSCADPDRTGRIRKPVKPALIEVNDPAYLVSFWIS